MQERNSTRADNGSDSLLERPSANAIKVAVPVEFPKYHVYYKAQYLGSVVCMRSYLLYLISLGLDVKAEGQC